MRCRENDFVYKELKKATTTNVLGNNTLMGDQYMSIEKLIGVC